jgi:transposase-like protein
MNEQAKGPADRYDEAFKRQAVEHWLVSGKSARQISAELGFNEQSLKMWKRPFRRLPAGRMAPTIAALQAGNRRLQRDMLEKPWAFFPNRSAAVCPDIGHARRTLHRGAVRGVARHAERLLRLGCPAAEPAWCIRATEASSMPARRIASGSAPPGSSPA